MAIQQPLTRSFTAPTGDLRRYGFSTPEQFFGAYQPDQFLPEQEPVAPITENPFPFISSSDPITNPNVETGRGGPDGPANGFQGGLSQGSSRDASTESSPDSTFGGLSLGSIGETVSRGVQAAMPSINTLGQINPGFTTSVPGAFGLTGIGTAADAVAAGFNANKFSNALEAAGLKGLTAAQQLGAAIGSIGVPGFGLADLGIGNKFGTPVTSANLQDRALESSKAENPNIEGLAALRDAQNRTRALTAFNPSTGTTPTGLAPNPSLSRTNIGALVGVGITPENTPSAFGLRSVPTTTRAISLRSAPTSTGTISPSSAPAASLSRTNIGALVGANITPENTPSAFGLTAPSGLTAGATAMQSELEGVAAQLAKDMQAFREAMSTAGLRGGGGGNGGGGGFGNAPGMSDPGIDFSGNVHGGSFGGYATDPATSGYGRDKGIGGPGGYQGGPEGKGYGGPSSGGSKSGGSKGGGKGGGKGGRGR